MLAKKKKRRMVMRVELLAVKGVCCTCGSYDPDDACAGREDGVHCKHWWDGPPEDRCQE